MTVHAAPHLVETAWLAEHFGDQNVRVLDCTVQFSADADGVRVANGRAVYDGGHIPGSVFADVVQELSDQNSALPFMMPPPSQFAATVARLGVGDDTHVVLYDACADGWSHMWAARVWWMLRVCGVENVSVLNGGMYKWVLEGRPVSTEPGAYPPGQLTVRFRPDLMASKEDVLAVVGDGATCIINALPAEAHSGVASTTYPRPGHIASSVNVPTMSLIDPATHAYLPPDQLRSVFQKVDALDRERVITYCGGGIAASSDALILTMLGAQQVAVYDGSLSEWAADPSLPMETGGGDRE